MDIQLVEMPMKGGSLRWAVRLKGSGLRIAKRECNIEYPPLLLLGET